jgi:hypothetical protein
MVSSKKIFFGIIASVIGLVIALIFISSSRNDAIYIEKSLNSTYTAYKESPDDFIITEARILEEYDFDSGDRIDFLSLTNQWLVSVKIDDKTELQTTVMRDAEHDAVGNVIKVAYKKMPQGEYSSKNLQATQLKYVEDTSARRSCNIATAVCTVLLAALVIYTAVCFIKKKDSYM